MNINATLLGQMVTFALLVLFTMKYVWPPVTQALDERRKKIADGLAAAERGHHEMELAEKKARTILSEARTQAAEIVNLAQKRAGEIVDESKSAAKVEGERLVALAQSDIDQQMQQARDSLSRQVASLAVAAAEQILQREVDQARHSQILSGLARQLS